MQPGEGRGEGRVESEAESEGEPKGEGGYKGKSNYMESDWVWTS